MASSPSPTPSPLLNKKMTLVSSDNESFEVEASVLSESKTISNMLEDTDDYCEAPIPLPNIRGLVLSKVIEFCKKRTASGKESEEELKKWDEEFVNVDKSVLLEMISAATFLDIRSLLHLTARTVADRIKDLPIPEIREIFGIVNDFTPEEEEKLRQENAWAFELID